MRRRRRDRPYYVDPEVAALRDKLMKATSMEEILRVTLKLEKALRRWQDAMPSSEK